MLASYKDTDISLRDIYAMTRFYEGGYSKFREDLNRFETWEEAVERVMDMHRSKYQDKITPELTKLINKAESLYKKKAFLGSQRALQFGGDKLLSKNTRMYNCAASYVDRPKVFGETYFALLCGVGAGLSLQKLHIAKLPKVTKPEGERIVFTIPDTIEGWSEALDVLMSSFFVENQVHSEYFNKYIIFDYSLIRPKGSMISGGFKAPGPEPLRICLDKTRDLLTAYCATNDKLNSITLYDILMYVADSVISGGVRRSATIILFSEDDTDMLMAKTGDWWKKYPHRRRSNNSAVIVRKNATRDKFASIFEPIKQFGEPGFYITDHEDILTNPCVTADTMILTSEGRKPVSELIGVLFEANVDGKLYPSKGFWETGTKEVFLLETKEGFSLKATKNHKILTYNVDNMDEEWVELGDILIDSYVILNDIPEHTTELAQVTKITSIGFEKVYDAEVSTVHRFDANGIIVHNCVEIGLYPKSEDGESGWQTCNLSDINGAYCNTVEKFFEACEGAAIIGTLQAGYTDFGFLGETTKNITEREALLGVSITGVMSNPDIFFSNKEVLNRGAEIVRETNKIVASLIGINAAARLTCVKPSGNSAVLLGTSSGIHGDWSEKYIRHIQINKENEFSKYLEENMPWLIEPYEGNTTDNVMQFPTVVDDGALFNKDLLGVNLLEKVKFVQENWVIPGTNKELCVNPDVRHNVSNTVSVDSWEEVEQYIWDNKDIFAGVSLMSSFGDKAFYQAPWTEIIDMEEIIGKYGQGAMFASGLIVDAIHAFGNLWKACNTYQYNTKIEEDELNAALKIDWLRRLKKFSVNYFEGNIEDTIDCIKSVHLLHKWAGLQRHLKKMKKEDWDRVFTEAFVKPKFIEVDTMAAQACAGGACEVNF